MNFSEVGKKPGYRVGESLAGRAAFYSKAEFRINTSAQALEPTFAALRTVVRQALELAA